MVGRGSPLIIAALTAFEIKADIVKRKRDVLGNRGIFINSDMTVARREI